MPLEGLIGEQINNLIYSGLWVYDDHGNLVPDLATAVPTFENGGISKDGLTVIVHLRHGVVWQDGAPLTAHDVVFTYKAIKNPANIVTTRTFIEPIVTVEEPNLDTVIYHLSHPAATLIMALSTMYMPILPAHLLERYSNVNHVPFDTLPTGSGPFAVVEWIHGDHLTLRRNEKYWRGPPKLRTVILKFIPNPNSVFIALRTGDVDAWIGADLGQYPELKTLSGYAIHRALQNRFASLDFNVRDPLLADVRVRRAIAAAIDRKRLIDSLIYGLGEQVDADQPRGSWAFEPNLPHEAFDPSDAAAILDSLGWRSGQDGVRQKNGKRLELQIALTPAPREVPKIAELIQSELRAVGFDASLKEYSQEKLYARAQDGGILYSGHYQASVDYWTPNDDPDDIYGFGCDQLPPAGLNWNFWCDRRADAAMHDAVRTFDIARRKRDYAIVQEEIARTLPAVFLWQADRLDVLSTHFQGFTPSYDAGGIWNAWEWKLE